MSTASSAPIDLLLMSATDTYGGAGRAAFRLHQGLRRIGVCSELLVRHQGSGDRHVRSVVPGTDWMARVRRTPFAMRSRLSGVLRRTSSGQTALSSAHGPIGPRELSACIEGASMFNLHWVSGYLDLPTVLPYLAERGPIVWTLHDLSPLNRGWHYDCTEAERRQILARFAAFDANRTFRHALARVPSGRLVVVGPSSWMTRRAKTSRIFSRFECVTIANGLDTENFQAADMAATRKEFGLSERPVISFAGHSVTDPRKGLRELMEAVTQLGSKVTMLAAGKGDMCSVGVDTRHVDIRHLGTLSDDALSHFYSASDIFACPSLQDNLPSTVMEAMACGRPVVAFDTGGIADMVVDGETGLLVKTGDSRLLANALERLIKDDALRARLGSAARERAVRLFSLEVQARNYRDLFARMGRAF